MSERTMAARQAVLKAWKREQELVNEGKGTYDWTPEQQQTIHDFGIAYDEDGYAFQGHHMQSVELFPQYQGDPENIQFLSKADHIKAHNGWYGNLTNWYYNPVTGEKEEFLSGKYKPCSVILLKQPVYVPISMVADSIEPSRKQNNNLRGITTPIYSKATDEGSTEGLHKSTNVSSLQEVHRTAATGYNAFGTLKNSIRKIGVQFRRFWDRNGDDIVYYAKSAGRFVLEHAPEILSVIIDVRGSSSDRNADNFDCNNSKSESGIHNHNAQTKEENDSLDTSMVNSSEQTDIDESDGEKSIGTPKSPHPRVGYEGFRWKKNENGERYLDKVPVKPTYIHPDQVDFDSNDDEE